MRNASSTRIVTLILLMAAGAAWADAQTDFLAKAMQTSMAEVELGKLAQKNAQSSGVKRTRCPAGAGSRTDRQDPGHGSRDRRA